MTTDLRYPIGRFARPTEFSDASRSAAIGTLGAIPATLRKAVHGLTNAQLDTPYRPEGWTVRQLVHHVADSHMHASARTRLILTEDNPTIKGYDEKLWGELHDSLHAPIESSLNMIDGIHERWVALLNSLPADQFNSTMNHSERGPMALDAMVALYAWHGPHHVAHVTELKRREGWQ
jgi:hypothetical protein